MADGGLAGLATKKLTPREETRRHYSSGVVLRSFGASVANPAHGRVYAQRVMRVE
jgi:hypothetical protein